MTDAEYEAAKADYARLKAESDRLWALKKDAEEAWYQAALLSDAANRVLEREQERRAWRAEFSTEGAAA